MKKQKKENPLAIIIRIACVSAIPEYRFHSVRKWRFDFAIPLKRIAIEYEGGIFSCGRHTRGAGFVKDCEKYNAAAKDGWRVFRFTCNDLTKNNIAKTIDFIKEISG